MHHGQTLQPNSQLKSKFRSLRCCLDNPRVFEHPCAGTCLEGRELERGRQSPAIINMESKKPLPSFSQCGIKPNMRVMEYAHPKRQSYSEQKTPVSCNMPVASPAMTRVQQTTRPA